MKPEEKTICTEEQKYRWQWVPYWKQYEWEDNVANSLKEWKKTKGNRKKEFIAYLSYTSKNMSNTKEKWIIFQD